MFNRYAILVVSAAALTLLYVAFGPNPLKAHSNVLWKIVHSQCVPNQNAHGSPAPCSVVSISGQYAVLKDLRGKYQFLLIPTNRVTGIEDPIVLEVKSVNYFSDAWNNRSWLESRLQTAVSRQDVALAVNSKFSRSQNQLHIHIDCVRPDVAAALAAHAQDIGMVWSVLALPPAGHKYQIRRIEAADLRNSNPFLLVAGQSPAVRQNMGGETIVVIGAQFANGEAGFFLLSDKFDAASSDPAAGVELQDQSCAIAHPK